MSNFQWVIISFEVILFLMVLWLYQQVRAEKNKPLLEAQHKDYPDYLQSKRWEQLRKLALERADYKCELCNTPYEAVHHIRYPKKYHDDHVDNLLVVCAVCHAKLHGVRESNEVSHQGETKLIKEGQTYSDEIACGKDAYFFEVEYLNGKKQLVITEDRSAKQTMLGDYRIKIYEANLVSFVAGINKAFAQVKIPYELYSDKLMLGECSYFFDVKMAVNGRKYLTITVSEKVAQGSFKRSSITVFEDELDWFREGFKNALKFLGIN